MHACVVYVRALLCVHVPVYVYVHMYGFIQHGGLDYRYFLKCEFVQHGSLDQQVWTLQVDSSNRPYYGLMCVYQ